MKERSEQPVPLLLNRYMGVEIGTHLLLHEIYNLVTRPFIYFKSICAVPVNDRGFSFERNCVLRRWESETLK